MSESVGRYQALKRLVGDASYPDRWRKVWLDEFTQLHEERQRKEKESMAKAMKEAEKKMEAHRRSMPRRKPI